MLTEFISALCTLGLVILAILVTVRAIPAEDAFRMIGKGLLIVFLGLFAICELRVLLRTGLAALAVFLKAALLSLAVTVSVTLLVMLLVWLIKTKFPARRKVSHDGGEP
jgi:hypothetical protein